MKIKIEIEVDDSELIALSSSMVRNTAKDLLVLARDHKVKVDGIGSLGDFRITLEPRDGPRGKE